MKKYVTLSLFIFCIIFTAVLSAGIASNNKNTPLVSLGILNPGQVGNTTPTSNVNNQNKLSLTKIELAKHNSSKSCWLLISGKIYDVTTFLNQHPGNASTILPSCGKDATSAYNTKGPVGRPHSANATSMLADYFIGNLNQSVNTPSSGTNPPIPVTQSNPRGGGEFDD